MVGGENQQGSLIKVTGYSVTAHCTGKPAYLEPNSNSMQKPIGGLLALLKNVEDRSAIGGSRNQKHAEKTERNSHSQTPHKTGKTQAKTNISRTATYCPVNIIMTYCPECGGEMQYVIATKHYDCKSCGLSVTRQELMELREKLRPSVETAEEEKEKHRKEYLKWWLSKKK